MEYSSNLSAIYTRSCAQTFPPIFGLSQFLTAISQNVWRHLATKNENYVVRLKGLSIRKKTLKTASKSAYKRQRNACSNYAPLKRTARRPRSVTKNIPTPCFCTYSRRMLYDLPQTLHGDRARRGHLGAIHFSIQRIVFPTGCTEKFGLIDQRVVSQQ